MKGGYLLSYDEDLLVKFANVLASDGIEFWASDDGVQFRDRETSGLFTIDKTRPEVAWDFRDPPHFPLPGVALPDMSSVLGYGVDCRWEHLFVRTVRRIALASGQPAWVLDGDGVVWDATAVDPERVRL